MKSERFSQLWDALVTGRPRTLAASKKATTPPITNGVSKETIAALIAYGKGDKKHFEGVRKELKAARG